MSMRITNYTSFTITLQLASSVKINSWLRLSTVRCVPLRWLYIQVLTIPIMLLRWSNVITVHNVVPYHDSSGPVCSFKMSPIKLLTVPNESYKILLGHRVIRSNPIKSFREVIASILCWVIVTPNAYTNDAIITRQRKQKITYSSEGPIWGD
jgi:hypothetical protein